MPHKQDLFSKKMCRKQDLSNMRHKQDFFIES